MTRTQISGPSMPHSLPPCADMTTIALATKATIVYVVVRVAGEARFTWFMAFTCRLGVTTIAINLAMSSIK